MIFSNDKAIYVQMADRLCDGDTVTDQVPNAGMRIAASGKVIVYMGEEKPTEAVEVPDLSGSP